MNQTKIIFLRHADTQKDPSVNAALWGLSEKGKDQAQQVSDVKEMETVDIIYVSEEQKTSLTAGPIAQKLKKEIKPLGFFNEVQRGDKFLTKEEFEMEKERQLLDLNFKAFGGESGFEALKRFKEGVEFVKNQNQGKIILIVTHGTVLNIYFADLLGVYNELPERWKKTEFCALGIVMGDKIIKDIV